ncbi:LPS export ABC transporter periplasmic protein LptC [Thalassospiraceae bacterium LMO-JJ14]|nr:LPS export ABC transporter periplasmic protein LptC [Thalassospiraceae bacterium LMO-JJ14]
MAPATQNGLELEGRKRGGDLGFESRGPRRHTASYSHFVRAMKFLLPAIALLLIGLIIAWPHIQVSNSKFRIGFADLTVKEADDPSMLNPRYIGADDDDQPYSVTAEIARRLSATGSVIELDSPKADILLEDGTWLVLTARRGIYGRDAESLNLVGSVVLYHDTGYEFLTEKAKIDLEKSSAEGDQPIRGQGPFGNLQAEGFRLVDKGKTIYFTGKSKLVIYPGAGQRDP